MLESMKTPMTQLAYCQYLLVSQINYTLTNFADHCEEFSHDTINRYLRGDRVRPRALWDAVERDIVTIPQGYLLFDDTVLDKNYSHRIELVRRQWSGNKKTVINGIGVVTCVYVNPATDQFWLIDFRLYDPDGDGKTKLDHVHEMLSNSVYHKRLPFQAVLMDSWYAAKELMLFIESLGKFYYCPLKGNRQVDDSAATVPYKRVDLLDWTAEERERGKIIKVKGFPKYHKLRLFRVEVSTHRTDWVVTNDLSQESTEAAHQVCGFPAGGSRRCIEKPSRLQDWSPANAAKPVSSAITSVVLSLSGLVSNALRPKPDRQSTNSNTACLTTILFSN